MAHVLEENHTPHKGGKLSWLGVGWRKESTYWAGVAVDGEREVRQSASPIETTHAPLRAHTLLQPENLPLDPEEIFC